LKGEDRLDLNQLLKGYPKCDLLVTDFFGVEDKNEIHFRDLYDFFDKYDYHPTVEHYYRNENAYWVHNIMNPSHLPVSKQKEFKYRKDAELQMFILSFHNMEEILTPLEPHYRTDTTSNFGFYNYGDNDANQNTTDFTELPF